MGRSIRWTEAATGSAIPLTTPLLVKFNKRLSNGLTIQASYSFSKILSDYGHGLPCRDRLWRHVQFEAAQIDCQFTIRHTR